MRWWILALLFAATTINYLDRIVFSVLAPEIRDQLHFDEHMYSYLQAAFQMAYTVGYLVTGKVVDLYGTKIGYGVAAALWSVAAAMHATAGVPLQLGVWRAMLGLAESANFPACIKAVSEWFPAQERAFATGIFNSGTNIASVVGPPVFVWLYTTFGSWRPCFLLTGGLGFIWLALWWTTYRTPRQAALEEATVQISWTEALGYRQTWGFALGKFLTDPVWWFYLYWLPLYFHDVRGFDRNQTARALVLIYCMASLGSMAGGWLSGFLMQRGWTKSKARKTAMFICAAAMPVAALGVLANSGLAAVLLFSLATSAHQGWSANLFTTTSDVFPKSAVGSVNGIGGCLGGLGGVIFSALIPGFVIQRIGYAPLFLVMSSFYLIALLVVHVLMRDLRPVGLTTAPAATP